MVRLLIVVFFLVSVTAQAAPRMSEQQVIAAARPVIEARFRGATKSHQLVAHVITDGFWTIFFVHRGQPDRPKHGEPVAHVRDSDGKVVDVSVAP